MEEVDEPFELVTPTGAALLSVWRTAAGPISGSHAVKTAYSFGHRKLKGRPNLLRASLYESGGRRSVEAPNEAYGSAGASPSNGMDECLVLECNLDDTTPELLGCLFDQLLEAGALDVFTTPVFMKKQRQGVLLTVLCVPTDREIMLDLIFRESTTFGIRERLTKRTVLERSFETVDTPFGKVRIKVGKRNGEIITTSPEIEDCRRLAMEKGVAVRVVYEASLKETRL